MRILLLITALLVSGAAAAQPATSRAALTAGRVGTVADLHGTVALYNRDAQQIECSGVLVAADLVLTAAHCVVELADDDDPLGPYPPDRFAVIAGELRPDLFDETNHYDIDTIVAHADFMLEDIEDPITGLGNVRDIALLFLVEPILRLNPVPLLTAGEAVTHLQVGSPVVLTGYGVHDLVNTDEGALHWGDATVARRLAYEMLVGGDGEADTCVGDSGGPVYVRVAGELKVAGIASRGPDDSDVLCGDGTIAVVIAGFYDWIVGNARGRVAPDAPPLVGTGAAPPPGHETPLPPRCNCASGDGPVSPVGVGVVLLLLGLRRRRGQSAEG